MSRTYKWLSKPFSNCTNPNNKRHKHEITKRKRHYWKQHKSSETTLIRKCKLSHNGDSKHEAGMSRELRRYYNLYYPSYWDPSYCGNQWSFYDTHSFKLLANKVFNKKSRYTPINV